MALFGGSAKKDAVENEILQAMSDLEILDLLVKNVAAEAEEENPWITNCQGYYDNCIRTVTIAADMFEVKWSDISYERDAQGKEHRVENVNGRLAYSYTKSGYTPLHSHYNEKGKEDVSVSRVIYLWTTLVHERLQSKLADCSFGYVREGDGFATFDYKVPALTWKRWF